MDQFDNIKFKKSTLKRRRAELIKRIADCADSIKAIDRQLAVIESCELEEDLTKVRA